MKEHAAYVDDSDDSVQGRSVAKPFPDSSQDKKGSSTTSGKFFAESLSQTMGTQMNPGAMLQTSMKQPSARVATKMPGSPLTRKASSRLAMLGPVNSPLPSSSPRRLARTDGRSGTVVIWGDGWARSASPCKLDRDSPGPMPGSPFTPSKAPAIDTVMHPLVDEEEDLSATPRPENAGKPVGFEKPKQDQEFIGHKMLAVCGGFGKLALITDDGMVVQSGDATEDNDAPMEIPDCGSVRQVVAGQKHVLFLDSAGGLYAGGQNTFGQLGFPGEPSVAVPRAVPAFSQRPVAAVACGQHHSLAVTDWGDVYAWGRGSEGQLGCGRFDTIPVPRYVHGLKGQFVDAIACGYMSSMAVTQKGQLYTWGDDTTGQLGLGPKAGRQATPRRVMLAAVPGGAEEDEEGSAFVVRAAGGWGHTCAVTSGGVVWAWGFGGRGQLGLGDFETRAWPSRVRGMLDGVHVRLVTCGGYFSVALSTEGHIYVWGSGAHHRLGLGDDKDRCEPVLATLKGKDITQLAVTEDRVMAFAPAHIMKLSPDCGPLGGGTRVNIAGDGLFDAERIKVSMDMTAAAQEHEQGDDVEARTGTGAGSSAQESLTVYGLESLRSTMAVSQGVEMRFARGALDPFTGMVVFDTPRHDKPTMCLVEVSFDNGETYTSSGRTYTFYAEPSIAAVEPFCRITSGEVLLSLKGPGLQLAGAYTTVRFSAAGVDPVVVSAEWRDEEGALLCWSPPFPKGKVVVEVALNGQQVSPNGCEVIYFEPPKVVRMEPNCCELGQASTRMLMTCSNMVKDLRLRFRGDCFERDVVIEGADMQACDGDDIGSMTFEVPAPLACGLAAVELSVDGKEWLKQPPEAASFFVYASLQPQVKFKNVFAGGGSVNAISDDGEVPLFDGTSFCVRVGETGTLLPAKFDPRGKEAVFTVPAYDARTMGEDAQAVPVFFHPQGSALPVVPCAVALRYFGGAETEVAVTSLAPAEGEANTAISISGDNFPEPYVPPEPEPLAEGEEQQADEAAAESEPAKVRKQEAPCWFVQFEPMEGVMGKVVVVEAEYEEGGLNCSSPEGLQAGEWRVAVSFDGPQGKWFEAGVFAVTG